VDLVFEVHKTFIPGFDQRLKDAADRHDPFTDCDLAFLAMEVGQVLHMNVEQASADLADGLNDICAGPRCMAHIHAAPNARVHMADGLKHIQR